MGFISLMYKKQTDPIAAIKDIAGRELTWWRRVPQLPPFHDTGHGRAGRSSRGTSVTRVVVMGAAERCERLSMSHESGRRCNERWGTAKTLIGCSASPLSHDEGVRERLWRLSLEQTGCAFS